MEANQLRRFIFRSILAMFLGMFCQASVETVQANQIKTETHEVSVTDELVEKIAIISNVSDESVQSIKIKTSDVCLTKNIWFNGAIMNSSRIYRRLNMVMIARVINLTRTAGDIGRMVHPPRGGGTDTG